MKSKIQQAVQLSHRIKQIETATERLKTELYEHLTAFDPEDLKRYYQETGLNK